MLQGTAVRAFRAALQRVWKGQLAEKAQSWKRSATQASVASVTAALAGKIDTSKSAGIRALKVHYSCQCSMCESSILSEREAV